MPNKIACVQVIGIIDMHLRKPAAISMVAQQQRRQRPAAGALPAALLLLCLALLLMLAPVDARPAPPESDHGSNSNIDERPHQEVTRAPRLPLPEKSALPFSEANEDDSNWISCNSRSTTGSCEDFDRRMLDDYGSPDQNHNSHPGGGVP